MTAKRPIAAMDLPGVTPGAAPTPKPEITWISPTELLVDETYQRNLSDKSRKLIAKIVGEWDWRKFKPPVAAWTEEGLEVIDGQHTAIAAATHPAIDQIPVVVVEASEQAQRASAFLGHNRDRLAVTALQMHAAAVVAGDEEAVTIEQVCQRAGVKLLRSVPSGGVYQPGQTIAVAALKALITRRSAKTAREILQALAAAERAPITANDIKAVELLLTDAQYAETLDPEDLSRTIRTLASAEPEAKVFAAAHGVPFWKALAITWFQKCRKRRRDADASHLRLAASA